MRFKRNDVVRVAGIPGPKMKVYAADPGGPGKQQQIVKTFWFDSTGKERLSTFGDDQLILEADQVQCHYPYDLAGRGA